MIKNVCLKSWLQAGSSTLVPNTVEPQPIVGDYKSTYCPTLVGWERTPASVEYVPVQVIHIGTAGGLGSMGGLSLCPHDLP